MNTISPRGWKSTTYDASPLTTSLLKQIPPSSLLLSSSEKSDELGRVEPNNNEDDVFATTTTTENEQSKPGEPSRRSVPRFSIRSSRRSTQRIIDTEIESFQQREAELRKERGSAPSD